MVKKSMFCYRCDGFGKIPIYHRENRVHKVAFYLCSECMDFSGFIDTWLKKDHRTIPYFNDMKGKIRMRNVKNKFLLEKIRMMRINPFSSCIKCKKNEIAKLFVRIRKKKTFEFVGYICKKCRIGYLIKNSVVKLRSRDPTGYYNSDGSLPSFDGVPFNEDMGFFSTTIAEDDEKPIEDQVTISIEKKNLPKLKKVLEKSKISFETVR